MTDEQEQTADGKGETLIITIKLNPNGSLLSWKAESDKRKEWNTEEFYKVIETFIGCKLVVHLQDDVKGKDNFHTAGDGEVAKGDLARLDKFHRLRDEAGKELDYDPKCNDCEALRIAFEAQLKEEHPRCVNCDKPVDYGHFVAPNQVMCHACWVARGNAEQCPSPEPAKITRYGQYQGGGDIEKLDDGDYVLYEEHVAELRALREDLLHHKSVAMERESIMQIDIDDLKKQLAILKAENERLKRDNRGFRALVETHEDLKAEHKAEVERLKEQIDAWKVDFQGEKDRAELLTIENERLKATIVTQKEGWEEALVRWEKLKEYVDRLNSEVDEVGFIQDYMEELEKVK